MKGVKLTGLTEVNLPGEGAFLLGRDRGKIILIVRNQSFEVGDDPDFLKIEVPLSAIPGKSKPSDDFDSFLDPFLTTVKAEAPGYKAGRRAA